MHIYIIVSDGLKILMIYVIIYAAYGRYMD